MSQRAERRVYLVTDTSWWLDQGWRIAVDVVDRLEDGDPFFFVPAGVMRELDGLKRDSKRGKRALEATKRIHELISMGRCRIVEGNGRRKGMLASPVDEEVVEIARTLREKAGNVYLLTTDRAQMAVAENVGVESAILGFGKKYLTGKEFIKAILILATAPISFPLLWLKGRKKIDNIFHLNSLTNKMKKSHFPGNLTCPCPICSDTE